MEIRSRKSTEWVSDCSLAPNQQFLSYVMTRTSEFAIKWRWDSLCTRPTRLAEFLWRTDNTMVNQYLGYKSSLCCNVWCVLTLNKAYYILCQKGTKAMTYTRRTYKYLVRQPPLKFSIYIYCIELPMTYYDLLLPNAWWILF